MMTINARTLYLGRLERSPLGPLWAAVTANGLAAVEWDMSFGQFTHQLLRRFPGASIQMDAGQTADALRQLNEFLAGKHRAFDLPIDWSGMGEFQVRALKQTAAIPYGSTTTYAEIARQIAQAHGGALAAANHPQGGAVFTLTLPYST